MAPKLLTAAATVLPLLPAASAWGTLGHYTVAYIAQNFVTSDTKSWAQDILGSTSSSYLASVATWADSYRYTTEGEFSAAFHYIDANDSPPESCNVDYDRDCTSEGCVVSAIGNYTERVQASSLSSTEVQKALKWIVHFVGDIHQPLHDEALETGGNGISVLYDGDTTNLHHIWDSDMAEQLRGGYSLSVASSWASELTTSIKSGDYASEASSWLSGISIDDPVSTAMDWATDANSFVCTAVIPDGVSAVEDKELSGDYYDSAIPTVELQIAKAGYRLAAWLNLIATGDAGLEVAKVKKVRRDADGKLKAPRHWSDLPKYEGLTKAQLARMANTHRC